MTSSFDAYSCILHAERSLEPYVQASCNYSNFHFCGTLPCSTGRASPACPRHGAGGCAQSPPPPCHRERGAACGLQRGDITVAAEHRKKPLCSFLDSFSEVLLPPWFLTPLRGGRKMPLNLAEAALSIFLPPTNTAQPLMSHNWLLSAPNHFTEVRINF